MKRFLAFICAIAILLSLAGCGSGGSSSSANTGDGGLVVAATTYPIYLFTTAIVGDVEGVTVEQVITDKVSCIHDYTLTVPQMKIIEAADIVVENGAGFEDFMSDVLAASDAEVVDSSEGISLLKMMEDGTEEDDPHIWMSPDNAKVMLKNIADGLSAADSSHAAAYSANYEAAVKQLDDAADSLDADKISAPQDCKLITFHDGFQYFAQYFGFDLVASIEEESGSEASAKDIESIVSLVKQYDIPAVFTEVNGSDTTAQAIARETGAGVYSLDLIMSGDGSGIEPYIKAINGNYYTVHDVFAAAAG
ncbi:MAG: metal ABC transporter substrate-binding protein [Oscillospiraceae bacterium]|nr:metal ABC transporter substrate-binding protein [Oscillospiraceae bacterium]